jgi:hypothetical protein
MIWSKKSEFIWYQINLYFEKTNKEEVIDEEDEVKACDKEKVTEIEDDSNKKEKKRKEKRRSYSRALIWIFR